MGKFGPGVNEQEKQGRLAGNSANRDEREAGIVDKLKLLTRTALAPFGCEEVKIKQGEEEDKSAGRLVIPKFPDETGSEEQSPSSSGKNQKRDDKGGENHRRSEEPMHRILIKQERMTIRRRQVDI